MCMKEDDVFVIICLSVLFVSCVIQMNIRLGSCKSNLLETVDLIFIQSFQISHKPHVDVHEGRRHLCDCLFVCPICQLNYTDES